MQARVRIYTCKREYAHLYTHVTACMRVRAYVRVSYGMHVAASARTVEPALAHLNHLLRGG